MPNEPNRSVRQRARCSNLLKELHPRRSARGLTGWNSARHASGSVLQRGGSSAPVRAAPFALIAVSAVSVVGCTPQLKPIFAPPARPIVWPETRSPAKIRYVGMLARAADLKPPRNALQGLAELLVGGPPEQQLYGPRSVFCTPDGRRVWVADPGGRCLHLFDLEHRRYAKVERVGKSHLVAPVGIAPGPPGSFYVCDSEDAAIHRVSDRDGRLIESLRLTEDILRPVAVAYDAADGGALYVVDAVAHNIKVLGPRGTVRGFIGRRGSAPGAFNFPCDIALDKDMIWVVDAGNQRVQALTRSGQPILTLGRPGDAPGDLALPKSVAMDGDGHVYVVDARFENVQVFDRSGRLLLFFGEEGAAPGEFWLPSGIFIDATNRIWICDSYNRRIQVFQYFKVPS